MGIAALEEAAAAGGIANKSIFGDQQAATQPVCVVTVPAGRDEFQVPIDLVGATVLAEVGKVDFDAAGRQGTRVEGKPGWASFGANIVPIPHHDSSGGCDGAAELVEIAEHADEDGRGGDDAVR